MAERGDGYDRLAAADLVSVLPKPPSLDRTGYQIAVSAVVLLALLIPCYFLLLQSLWYLLLVFGATFLSLAVGQASDPTPVMARIHRLRWNRIRAALDQHTAVRGTDSAVSGLHTGTWVGTRSAYEEARKRQGKRPNGSTKPAKSSYAFLVASYRINGAEYRLGYADGTAPTLNPRTPMLVHGNARIDKRLAKPAADNELQTARELEAIIGALVGNHGPAMTVATLPQWSDFDEEQAGHVLRALEAGELWGLICVNTTRPGRTSRLLPLLGARPREALDQATLTLTQVGFVWHQATRAKQIERDRRRVVMAGGKDESINFTGVFSGPVTAARGDVRNNRISQTQTNGLSADDVLTYMRTLLGSDAVDWQSTDLAQVRPVIQKAVDEGTVGDPKLTRAMKYLLRTANGVLVRVLGDYATTGLHSFFT